MGISTKKTNPMSNSIFKLSDDHTSAAILISRSKGINVRQYLSELLMVGLIADIQSMIDSMGKYEWMNMVKKQSPDIVLSVSCGCCGIQVPFDRKKSGRIIIDFCSTNCKKKISKEIESAKKKEKVFRTS